MRHFRVICLAFVCLSSQVVLAQSKPYALPKHNGAMLLDLDGFHITQQTAKPEGREIGVRAHDTEHTELLAFLFLTPGNRSQTPTTCLQQDLKQIRKDNGKFDEELNPFHTDNNDSATIVLTYPSGNQVVYKYAGAGDQCLFVEVYADKGSKLDLAQASALLARQHYDPNHIPTTDDVARYTGIQGGVKLAQKPPAETPKMLITWDVPGGILLPTSPEWKPKLLTAYDKGSRPIAQFENEKTNVVASFIIEGNMTGKPTAESCRKDVMDGIRKEENGPLLSNQTEGQMSDGHGGNFATASHFTYIDATSHNHDVFAFAGNKKTCAEIHISTVSGKPDEDKRLADALAEFHPDLSYNPMWLDYYGMGTGLYEESPMLAAPYFDSSLKVMPADLRNPEFITDRRLATDVVIVALERMGNLKASRTYAQHAIETDPDYPLTYYHLACMDAEQGKAVDAKLHLQQAFARKANAIGGEPFPDPTKDNSILKLKNDRDFWAFVQTLK